ncbi:MAG: T9SS type A sorting domain-containing protein [Chitinophagales bacterium]|nr:T9SS type A sorting domain-containing protein [Bacteroidota bacterium]MBP7398811.1 T9SS type A sorting domain-containing protein [Chitinophagales bacterium]MBK8681353.1 T9SS type A sorting domain-containing protein [Bacteroidota bacterium]MBP8753912.1 T9SS type A sorting domain-containing protein [Chitinophagales bacterium]MBP9188938.1 T9SS type A sorting domain-containing protein [Chitinophagales bacterium]
MRKNYAKSEKTNLKLAAYSAMAGAFALTGAAASAQTEIIYTDIDDVTLNFGEFSVLDIDDNGALDFYFEAYGNTATTAPEWSWVKLFGYLPTASYGNANNQFVGYVGPALPYGSALNEGSAIDSGASFIGTNAYGNVGFLGSIYSGATYGPFANQTDKYLGIRFDIDGELHYGWIRMDVSVGPVSVTIKDYAYRLGADEGIDAGQTEVEVGIPTIDAAKLNVYSFGNTVNIAVNNLNATSATVKVVNAVGQTVYSNDLNQSGMRINLEGAADGVYLVNIVADGAILNKQIFINN